MIRKALFGIVLLAFAVNTGPDAFAVSPVGAILGLAMVAAVLYAALFYAPAKVRGWRAARAE